MRGDERKYVFWLRNAGLGDEGDTEVGDHASLLLGDMRGGGLVDRSRCGRCLAGVMMSLRRFRSALSTAYDFVIGEAGVGGDR